MNFIEIFQSTDKYIKYINYDSIKDDVMRIDLRRIDVIGFNKGVVEEKYGIYCMFYSKNKLVEYSQFYEKENLWWTFNIALYEIINDKLKFRGWHY